MAVSLPSPWFLTAGYAGKGAATYQSTSTPQQLFSCGFEAICAKSHVA
jgi:hypothetical protein